MGVREAILHATLEGSGPVESSNTLHSVLSFE
jgi:hypothetical protein